MVARKQHGIQDDVPLGKFLLIGHCTFKRHKRVEVSLKMGVGTEAPRQHRITSTDDSFSFNAGEASGPENAVEFFESFFQDFIFG